MSWSWKYVLAIRSELSVINFDQQCTQVISNRWNWLKTYINWLNSYLDRLKIDWIIIFIDWKLIEFWLIPMIDNRSSMIESWNGNRWKLFRNHGKSSYQGPICIRRHMNTRRSPTGCGSFGGKPRAAGTRPRLFNGAKNGNNKLINKLI